MKKSWVVALVAGIVTLAYIDSNKLKAIQAEESRRLLEQANV